MDAASAVREFPLVAAVIPENPASIEQKAPVTKAIAVFQEMKNPSKRKTAAINKNRTEGLNNITFGQDVNAIWSFNATIQEWEEIKESDYFEIGRGYWIHSKIEKTWEVAIY